MPEYVKRTESRVAHTSLTMNAAMTSLEQLCRCCGQPVEGLEPPDLVCVLCLWAAERQRELMAVIEREYRELVRQMRSAGVN